MTAKDRDVRNLFVVVVGVHGAPHKAVGSTGRLTQRQLEQEPIPLSPFNRVFGMFLLVTWRAHQLQIPSVVRSALCYGVDVVDMILAL
jgi:hypothetical protein